MSKKAKVQQVEQNGKFDEQEFGALNGKSAKIRYLTSKGLTRSEIVKTFKDLLDIEIRYQHVRNVQVTQLKKDLTK